MKKQTLTIAALTLAAVTTSALPPDDVPRGPNVEGLAGNCGIGPFGQVSKAAYYNSLCKDMTDVEKCLALIKGQMHEQIFHGEPPVTPQYHFYPARGHEEVAKMVYCLDQLRSELLPEPPTTNPGE